MDWPKQIWAWLKQPNHYWIVNVAGIAGILSLVWAVYTHFSDSKPPPSETTNITASGGGIASRDISVGPGGIVAGGNVTEQHYYEGISEAKYQSLSEEFGVTKAAIKSFFKILEQKQVAPEDLDSTLREIARRYKALDKKLATFTSDDPAIKAFKDKAREALKLGDFDSAEQLLNEASDKDLQAAREIQAIAQQRLLSAAASKAENGELKYAQLAYVEAAEYYREAAALVPAGKESTRAGYLSYQGTAFLDAGRYAEAQQPLEHALAITEKALGPEHPRVGTRLNNLADLYKAQGHYE